jgi:exosortase B
MTIKSSTSPSPSAHYLPWVVIAIGLCLLYLPTFVNLGRTLWASEEQAHGPIVFAIALWLIGRHLKQIIADTESKEQLLIGWVIVILSIILYIIGHALDILLFEVGSFIAILAGIVLMQRGLPNLRLIWFGLFFMIFMIPLPGPFVSAVTQPMKIAVSIAAEHVLYVIGYPIARSGVILQIGQYQLLVADACAGLHTLFTLEALGLLYLNIVRHHSLWRNIVLAILIVPISFSANVVRVMVLSLITYHFGDEAGQGFLHGAAGMVLFLTALLLIISVDSLLRWGVARFRQQDQGKV